MLLSPTLNTCVIVRTTRSATTRGWTNLNCCGVACSIGRVCTGVAYLFQWFAEMYFLPLSTASGISSAYRYHSGWCTCRLVCCGPNGLPHSVHGGDQVARDQWSHYRRCSDCSLQIPGCIHHRYTIAVVPRKAAPDPLVFCNFKFFVNPASHTCMLLGDTGDQATEAMHAIADAVTQCKFEATDPAADEVVLYKILQVRP